MNLVRPGALYKPGANDHICPGVSQGIEKLLYLARVVLTVGVYLHHDVISVTQRPPKAATQGSANAEVHRKAQHVGTGGGGPLSSSVGGPIVYDADVIAHADGPAHNGRDASLLVKGGND